MTQKTHTEKIKTTSLYCPLALVYLHLCPVEKKKKKL